MRSPPPGHQPGRDGIGSLTNAGGEGGGAGRGRAVTHICLWIIAAVKSFNQSQNARIKKQEQFSDAPVVILIPDFSRKYELINVRQIDSAQRRWKIRRCLQSLLLCLVITDS